MSLKKVKTFRIAEFLYTECQNLLDHTYYKTNTYVTTKHTIYQGALKHANIKIMKLFYKHALQYNTFRYI